MAQESTAVHDLLNSLEIFNIDHADTRKGDAEEIERLVTSNGNLSRPVCELTHSEIKTVLHLLVQRAVRQGCSSNDQACNEPSFPGDRGTDELHEDDTGEDQRGAPRIDGENDVQHQAITAGGGTGLKRMHEDSLCPRDQLDFPIKKRSAYYTFTRAQHGGTGKNTWLDRPERETLEPVITNDLTSTSKPIHSSPAFHNLIRFAATLFEEAKDITSSMTLIEMILEALCNDGISKSIVDSEIVKDLLFQLWENVLSGLDCNQFLGAALVDIKDRPDTFRTHMRLGPIYLKLHLLTLLLLDRTLFLVDLAGADLDRPSLEVLSLCAFIVMFEVGRLDILNFYINIDRAYVPVEGWVVLQQSVSDSVFHCVPRLQRKSGPQLERWVIFVNCWLHRSVRDSSPSQQCLGLPELEERETAKIVDCCDRHNCLLLKVVVLFLYGSVEQFTAAFYTLAGSKPIREKITTENDQRENVDSDVVENLTECLMTVALFRSVQFKGKIATLLVLTPVDVSNPPVSFKNCCSSTLSTVCSENTGTISEEGRKKLLSWGVVFLLRKIKSACSDDWNSLIAILCCIDQPDEKLLDLVMDTFINYSRHVEMLDLVPLYWKPGLGLRKALDEVLYDWHKTYRWKTICTKDRSPLVVDRVLERMDLSSAEESLAVLDAILFSNGYSRRSHRDLRDFSRNTSEEKAEMLKAWLNHGGTAKLRGLCACQRLERGRPRSACSNSNVLLRAAKAGLEKSLVELLYEAGVCHPGCVRRHCKIIQKQKKPLCEVKEYCMTVWSSKVRSLQETCRIVVNDQIHCGPRRVERLWQGLPLPNNLKRYLLFHSKSELVPSRPVFDLSEICPDSRGGPQASLAQDDDVPVD